MHLQKFYILFATILSLGFASCRKADRRPLTIAVSANMQYATHDMAQVFEAFSGIPCQIITGSSGKLAAQIQQGAPFDVFLAADMEYPTALYHKGLTHKKPEIYAQGGLVLWTTKADIVPEMTSLSHPKITRVAIPNPRTAPYGKAAIAALQHASILDTLQPKLVYGESVAQTCQFIATGAADIGIIAQAMTKAPAFLDAGRSKLIPSTMHPPISQGIALIKTRKTPTLAAQKFREFLFSDQGKTILNTFGFTTMNPTNEPLTEALY